MTGASSTTSAISVANLCKTYRGSVRALDGVSLEMNAGEVFGLIGPNGAGKTTFLGCLLGLLRADSGTIRFDLGGPDDLEVRKATGYLPERLVFDRWMTGRQFVTYHHALAMRPAAQREAEVEAALTRVGLEPAARGMAIKKYSRGMLQRVGLAQAILGSPRYLFLDEPSSGVDPAGALLLRQLLLGLRAEGMTIVLNSHQLDQVEQLCDRVAFIRGGKLETVENLKRGETIQRVLQVRWGEADAAAIAPERLRTLAGDVGADLLELAASQAKFSVPDDRRAAALLKALVTAGVPVVEASPEERRLEKLFLERPREQA